jgi:fucose permease
VILFVCTVGCVLGSALTITLPNGRAPVALGILVFFFEAPIFPTLFAITLRGMGGRTRLVSTGIVMALCGGGIWPSVAYAIEKHQGGNARVSMSVVPVLYGACALYALMINASGTLRRWVDPCRSRYTPQHPTISSQTTFRMEKGSQEQVETTPQTQNTGFSD